VQVAEMQRSRLLAGAVRAVDELGWSGATVAHITGRARVSRRTFYDLFANREECMLAVLRDIAGQVGGELDAAGLDGLGWRERVRTGLWAILSFFDREPVLARFCVVESVRGGERVLGYREETLTRLTGAIDEGRGESARAAECPPLTAEGLVGAANAILYTRLLRGRREPLGDLLGELMSLIVLPYLGPAAAGRERRRPAPTASGGVRGVRHLVLDHDPLQDVPMRMTYRTALVLEGIAAHPGVSNREVAEHVGITDQGQVSKLLARLEKLGLLGNSGLGQAQGASNEWRLTPKGSQVEQSIRAHTHDQRSAA
jgi:AcrR family transcriptional regulator